MMVDVFFRMLININNCEIIIFVFYFIWVGSNICFVYLVKSVSWIRGYVVEFIVYKCCRWIFVNVFIVIFIELFVIVFDWVCFIVSIIKDIFFIGWIFFDVFMVIYEVICWIFGNVDIVVDGRVYVSRFNIIKFCFYWIFLVICFVVFKFFIWEV